MLVVTRRAPRTDRAARRRLILWGGWLLRHRRSSSRFAQRHHPRVLHRGAGPGDRRARRASAARALWQLREHAAARIALAVTVAGSSVVGARSCSPGPPDWHARGCATPSLVARHRLGALALLAADRLSRRVRRRRRSPRRSRRRSLAPAAYSLQTATTAHTGLAARRPDPRPAAASAAAAAARAAVGGLPAGQAPGGAHRPQARAGARRAGLGGASARPAGRRHGRPARSLDPAPRLVALLTADADALHVGRGGRGRADRGGLPARHRRPGDVARRLQRQRPVADARRSSRQLRRRPARCTTSSPGGGMGGSERRRLGAPSEIAAVGRRRPSPPRPSAA
ncbi:MAG: hypothetical protein V9F04_13900 [Dermatophilaceae bacterium]